MEIDHRETFPVPREVEGARLLWNGTVSSNPHMFGVPWIRKTFLSLEDLPPLKSKESK